MKSMIIEKNLINIFKNKMIRHYLTLGTRKKDGPSSPRLVSSPWQVFIIDLDPCENKYYIATEVNGNCQFIAEKLSPGSDDYGRVRKWVEVRNILKYPNQASSVVTFEKAEERFLENLV